MNQEEIKGLKPLFCRQGNKYLMRKEIKAVIPDHRVYVELFAGSGAIFFSKEKAEKNVLNDLDSSITKFYNTVKRISYDDDKDNPNLKTIPSIRKWYKKHYQDKEGLNYLIAEKIRTCNGFSAVPITNPNNIYQSHDPLGRIKDGMFEKYKDKLKDVIISNADYAVPVKKYDSPDTFFFIDPPYENTLKSFDYAEDTGFDFIRLRDVLKTIKGKFLMTINDSPNIRRVFSDFNMKPINVYSSWGQGGEKGGKKENYKDGVFQKQYRKELFITNYKTPSLSGGDYIECFEDDYSSDEDEYEEVIERRFL
jgi:DNA adenine methylase